MGMKLRGSEDTIPWGFFDSEQNVISDYDWDLSWVKYYTAAVTIFNLETFLGEQVKTPREADIIVFTDQYMVDPNLYGEELMERYKHTISAYGNLFHQKEINLYYDTMDMPKLGIGSGGHLLNVLNGGRLIQQVSNHYGKPHDLHSFMNTTLHTNSYHEQMMDLRRVNKENYRLLAWAESVSDMYETTWGKDDLEKAKVIKEPEVVYFPNTSSLCIQYRPDYGSCPKDSKKFAQGLIYDLIHGNL